MVEVGLRLAAARQAMDLKQVQVCAAIAVQPNTYSQWESGKRLADPLAVARFCDLYGITMDWIYRGQIGALPHSIADKVQAEYRRLSAIRELAKRRREPKRRA